MSRQPLTEKLKKGEKLLAVAEILGRGNEIFGNKKRRTGNYSSLCAHSEIF
jgi:hypothetical protein